MFCVLDCGILLCHDYACQAWHKLFLVEVALENLLSVEDAAKKLGGISKWTVYAWLSQGRLRRTKVGGRTMIRESELAKMIDDGGKSAAPRRGTIGKNWDRG
jgi:excisionase family DNA binding protein